MAYAQRRPFRSGSLTAAWRLKKRDLEPPSARRKLVLCRLMIDLVRTVDGPYAPAGEPFGTRMESFLIGLCIAIGDIDGKPLSAGKIAAFLGMSRTTVVRRLNRLNSLGLVERQGRYYYLQEKTLNPLIDMRSYQQLPRVLSKAVAELTILDSLPYH
jgi:biotin operon repressor